MMESHQECTNEILHPQGPKYSAWMIIRATTAPPGAQLIGQRASMRSSAGVSPALDAIAAREAGSSDGTGGKGVSVSQRDPGCYSTVAAADAGKTREHSRWGDTGRGRVDACRQCSDRRADVLSQK